MKYTLIKVSSPGWEKKFNTRKEVQAEMYKHVCRMCRKESDIHPNSDLNDMLSTDCGCEYDLEESK